MTTGRTSLPADGDDTGRCVCVCSHVSLRKMETNKMFTLVCFLRAGGPEAAQHASGEGTGERARQQRRVGPARQCESTRLERRARERTTHRTHERSSRSERAAACGTEVGWSGLGPGEKRAGRYYRTRYRPGSGECTGARARHPVLGLEPRR
jgi:hypothetical protein